MQSGTNMIYMDENTLQRQNSKIQKFHQKGQTTDNVNKVLKLTINKKDKKYPTSDLLKETWKLGIKQETYLRLR